MTTTPGVGRHFKWLNERLTDPRRRKYKRRIQQVNEVDPKKIKRKMQVEDPRDKQTPIDGRRKKAMQRLQLGKKYNIGGRANLLEEMGRLDAERMNPNRRAEKHRVIGELNKGYKSGGAVLKGKKVGCQIK